MAHPDAGALTSQIRLANRQKVLQQALTVPWRRIEEAASAYVEWHMFILWVRTMAEVHAQLPDVVFTTLQARCPGFFVEGRQEERPQSRQQQLLWHSLEEWIMANEFAAARADGWFDALMYYAYKDLRTEKAWTLWERAREGWRRRPPARWPTIDEWMAQVVATDSLTQTGTETARAAEAQSKVGSARLHRAVCDVIESRAFALWVACTSEPNRALREPALTAVCCRYPALCSSELSLAIWKKSSFFRLVRAGEADWRRAARDEGWHAALRHQVIHHPRYHRLVHYNQRCCEEWEHTRPTAYPCFPDWFAAADEYHLPQ